MRPGKPPVRLLAAILAAPLLLIACGDRGSPGADLGAKLKKLTIPAIDPNTPFPALSTSVFDALGADVPELAKHREALLAAERDAIKGAVDNLRAKSKSASKKVSDATPEAARLRTLALASWSRTDVENAPAMRIGGGDQLAPLIGRRFNLIPVAVAADLVFSDMGGLQQVIVGHNVVTLFGEGISNVDTSRGGGSKTVTMAGENGTVAAAVTLSAEANGPATVEVSTSISMPLLLLDAKSKVAITGDLCPNADGKVDFTIKMGSNGRAGSAGSSIYDANNEARVTATVGDDAKTVNVDFDLKQATRSTAGGRQVYIESSQAVRAPGFEFSKATSGEVKIRASSQATSDDAKLSDEGLKRALYLAIGAFQSAESFWQRGNCIKIEAASPGNVAPGTTSQIPVAVKHKKDGSSVPAKVTATLSGGASVDPGVIPNAPGNITHVASKEKQAKMTIALKATSRRGADEKSLDIDTKTAAAYQIVGGLDDWKTNTAVCDIMQPFTLTGGGFTMNVSGGLSGTYTYTGPFNAKGAGTYTISLPDGVGNPGTMTGGGAGSVTVDKVYTGTGTEQYKLSPINPCS